MTAIVYYPRNAHNVKLHMVIIYAVLMLIVPWVIWWKIRNFTLSTEVLVVLQLGLLIHFFGGIVVGESRMYDKILLSIRYDKFVHFYNCFAGYIGVKYLVDEYKLKLKKYEIAAIILVVAGLGSLIELIEYLGLKTLTVSYEPWSNKMLQPLYDNNMQDIFANLLGSIFGAIYVKFRK